MGKRIRFFLFILFFIPVLGLFAQQKFALVIGNKDYVNIKQLENPVNDVNAVAAKLRALGFQVDLKINIGKTAMDRAVNDYIQRLAANRNNEGFFWFAGHGVQIDGDNYLLPVDVDSRDDLSVKHTSFSVKYLTEAFDLRAKNRVNVVVLDACRENPFVNMAGRGRNLSRGLGVIQDQDLPPDLFIIYSTAAGDVADDGEGKQNSPFTEAFIKNIDSNEDLTIVVRSITRETLRLTNNKQRPFIGGSIISMDYYSLNPRKGGNPPPPPPIPPPEVKPEPTNMVRIQGRMFSMGSPANEPERRNNETQRQVWVSSFYIGKYEVTQKEYQAVMGKNPSHFKGDNLPVEMVSWYDAIEFCNALSVKEKLTPAYTIDKTRSDPNNKDGNDPYVWVVTWNKGANGYRLPTEAEWEYACRAGTITPFNTGDNITTVRANFDGKNYPSNNKDNYNALGESRGKTTAVGSFAANQWGLYDMHGNVAEWCWDWYGAYANGSPADPIGATAGADRVVRGGSWGYTGHAIRSAYRDYGQPWQRVSNHIGFRVARN